MEMVCTSGFIFRLDEPLENERCWVFSEKGMNVFDGFRSADEEIYIPLCVLVEGVIEISCKRVE